jgi:hemoglobin-like flavoprotein
MGNVSDVQSGYTRGQDQIRYSNTPATMASHNTLGSTGDDTMTFVSYNSNRSDNSNNSNSDKFPEDAPPSVASSDSNTSSARKTFDGDRVMVAYAFWKKHVDGLSRAKQQQLGLLLFSILFQKHPAIRQLFLNADIGKQSLRLLDMLSWLLKSLKGAKNRMRVRTLKSIGQRHVSYGVKTEYFAPMLEILNESLLEMCTDAYTAKIRYSLTLLFQSAGNEMMRSAGCSAEDLPFKELNSQQPSYKTNLEQLEKHTLYSVDTIQRKYRFLSSIDLTLADPQGFAALESFLHQSGCKELAEFHKAYRIYRCCLVPQVSREITQEVMRLFLTQGGSLELKNDALSTLSEARLKVQEVVRQCEEQGTSYPLDLFDDTHVWVRFQISQNWLSFKQAMLQQQYTK